MTSDFGELFLSSLSSKDCDDPVTRRPQACGSVSRRSNRGVRRLGPALPGETVPNFTAPVRVSGRRQGRFARHVSAPTRSSTSSTETARSTHGSIGSASISRSAGIGDGVRGRRFGELATIGATGVKTRRTNRPMPTRRTRSNGPSASRSSRPPSTSSVRNTGPS